MAGTSFSIIIPVRNGERTIGLQLAALLGQPWPGRGELLVVDNGSDDGTRMVVERFTAQHECVRLVDAPQTRGPAAARNAGVSAASGELLLFCDADDVVSRVWVAALVECLASCDAATGPIEVDRLNPPWLAAAPGRAHLAGVPRFLGIVPFAQTCNLAIRSDVMRGLGGFDESLIAGEDIDLGRRLQANGHTIAFEPTAVVHYRYRTSPLTRWHQGVSYGAAFVQIAGSMAASKVEGMPSRWAGARRWLWLARNVLMLRTAGGRARWQWVASQQVGRLVGSVRTRSIWL